MDGMDVYDVDGWLLLNGVYQALAYSNDMPVLYHVETGPVIEVVEFAEFMARASADPTKTA